MQAIMTPDWNDYPVTTVKAIPQWHEDHLSVLTSGGELQLRFYEQGMRCCIGKKGHDYKILVQEPTYWLVKPKISSNKTIVDWGDFQLHLYYEPFSWSVKHKNQYTIGSTSDGHFVRQYRVPVLSFYQQQWVFSLALDHDESIYGLGEKWAKLNKRGQIIYSYNQDALGVNAEASYKNTPFAWSPSGWGLFIHTPSPVTHAVGYAPWSQRSYIGCVNDTELDLFFWFAQDNVGKKILNYYSDLTGKAPLPPVWSLGVILSKAYYKTAAEIIETAKTVRKKSMPCDVITFDGRAWQDTATRFTFEWDVARYPDPKIIIDELKSLAFKICVWEYPYISVNNPLFNTLSDKGWLLKDKKTQLTYRYQWDQSCFGEVLTALPESGILDFTHPQAYQFWKLSHKPLFELGVDMIKADFGEQIVDSNIQAFNGDNGERLHNVYALLYNRCVYEAAQDYAKREPFLFSRSAWAGSQNYPSQWGGDPQADWGGLAASIRGALSWGLSGGPYYATDIGGFYQDERNDNLYVRWAQVAVFSAHMRFHGIGQREPWHYSKEAEQAVYQAIELRYRLLPYLQEYLQITQNSGLPVMQAMVLAFPEDPYGQYFETQFMFGDKLLVVPCLHENHQVIAYFPQRKSGVQQWRQLFSDKCFAAGEQVTLTLALDEIAVFIPVDEQIGLGRAVEHTGEINWQQPIEYYWP